MSVLAPLLTLYTVACLILMAVDFFAQDKVEVPGAITPVYIALLAAYAADKEIRRWVGWPEPPRRGTIFVYLWALLFLAFFTIGVFLPAYKLPREMLGIVLQVIGIFFGSKTSKYIYLSRKLAETDGHDEVAVDNIYRKAVFDFLDQHGKITRHDLVKAIGISDRQATRILNALARNGEIEQCGVGRGIYYVTPERSTSEKTP